MQQESVRSISRIFSRILRAICVIAKEQLVPTYKQVDGPNVAPKQWLMTSEPNGMADTRFLSEERIKQSADFVDLEEPLSCLAFKCPSNVGID